MDKDELRRLAEHGPVVRAALERQVTGALGSCIDAHGPITKDRVGSASKRVVSALLAENLTPLVDAVSRELGRRIKMEAD